MQTVFAQNPETLVRNIEDSDIIVVGSQECERPKKANRIGELEEFMKAHDFYNIDSTFCGMWEMFIVIFVKKELRKEIFNVKKQDIAQGQYGLVGNKGCVAYSFQLRDRIFNFISCHLKHGEENLEKRNKQSSEIVK